MYSRIKAFLQQLRQNPVLKNPDSCRWMILMLSWLLVSFGFLIWVFFHGCYVERLHNQQNQQLLSSLSTIQHQFEAMTAEDAHPQELLALKTIAQSVQACMNLIQKTTQDSTQQLSTQLTALQHSLVQWANHSDHSQNAEMTQKALPFQVVSLDVLADQPFVTIQWNQHIFPLSVGDQVANWELIRADYAHQIAEFQDTHGHTLTLHLGGSA